MLAVVGAALLYDRLLTGTLWLGALTDRVVIVALLVVAALLKADMYLAAAAFPALYLYRRTWETREVLVLGAMLAIPPLVSVVVAKSLLAGSTEVTTYFLEYQEQYKMQWWRAYNRGYVEGWLMTFGVFSVPLAAIGWFRLLFERRWWLAVALVLWAAPPFLFWFFRIGDSMRHHLPEAVPVAIGVGLAVTLLRARWLAGLAIVVLVGANYFRYPASADYFKPSGRVIESFAIHRDFVTRLQSLGEQYAAVDEPRKVLLGAVGNPYADAALLRGASAVTSAARGRPFGHDQNEHHFVRADGSPAVSISVRVNPELAPAAAARYAAEGYAVYSFEYDLAKGKPRDLGAGVLERFR